MPNEYQTLAVTSRPLPVDTADGYEVPLRKKQNISAKAGFANPLYSEDPNVNNDPLFTDSMTSSGAAYTKPTDGYTMPLSRTPNIQTDFTNPMYSEDVIKNKDGLCEEPVDLFGPKESQDGYATAITCMRTPVLQTKTKFTSPVHGEDVNDAS